MNESVFRFELNNDAMSTEKLAEGVRKFADDFIVLEQLIAAQL